MQSLSRVFDALHGGLIVAVSEAAGGTVRLIVENRAALSSIRDSWGRVAVSLSGCRAFTFSSSDGSVAALRKGGASGLRPVVRGAQCSGGVCRVECGFGLSRLTLEIDAEAFSMMLGSGRDLSPGELLGAPVEAEAVYAKAS